MSPGCTAHNPALMPRRLPHPLPTRSPRSRRSPVQLDDNKDGTLSVAEFEEGLDEFHMPVRAGSVKELFDALDPNSDGRVLATELIQVR